jgi:hypothetical protein
MGCKAENQRLWAKARERVDVCACGSKPSGAAFSARAKALTFARFSYARSGNHFGSDELLCPDRFKDSFAARGTMLRCI